MNWTYKGACWKFGDYLLVDGVMAPLDLIYARESRPEVLKDYAMIGIDPDFPKKVKAGDIIVAGKGFGSGHAHPQGALAIKGLQLGLIAESIPSLSLRSFINAGVPFLTNATGISSLCESGDELEIDFESGFFRNHTSAVERTFKPLSSQLLDIIAAGGWNGAFANRLKQMGLLPAST